MLGKFKSIIVNVRLNFTNINDVLNDINDIYVIYGILIEFGTNSSKSIQF
jgi:hypothetical protein